MTVMELKEIIDNMSVEDLDKYIEEFDYSQVGDEDMDLLELLNGAKLYEYLQYKNGDNLKVEL